MAPKRRGLSLEDKRSVILNIFQESKSVFVLKDIEKLAAKRGVVSQSVKDVLQSLVDDDLVNQDKIGISNFFWSFPSAASMRLENERSKLVEKLKMLEEEEDKASANIKKEKPGKEDCKEREALDEKIAKLQNAIHNKKRELEAFSSNDPTRFDSLKKMKLTSKEAANKWIDNIFAIQGWMKKTFQGMDNQIDQFLIQQGVPKEMDYID